jgi:two-component system, OmpR family, KDP operon response regulator KdpE
VSLESARVLIVEKKPTAAQSITFSFNPHAFETLSAQTPEVALRRTAQSDPDVIILDLDARALAGAKLIHAIRQCSNAPLVTLSSRNSEREIVRILDAGADYYLTKPISINELRAWTRAALRRGRTHGFEQKALPSTIEIDSDQADIRIDGQPKRLGRREYDVFLCLAQHVGETVTYRQLLAAGWGGEKSNEQLVRSLVALLRRKIEPDPAASLRIVTDPGIGYRLTCPN